MPEEYGGNQNKAFSLSLSLLHQFSTSLQFFILLVFVVVVVF